MEGMKDKLVSQVYTHVALNDEATKTADTDYLSTYHRSENLYTQQRTVLPDQILAIRNLTRQLLDDTRSDSTGTYTQMKKMAVYFVNNFTEFDTDMEIKAVVALHARACDYYNLHSSHPRRTSLGKNRMRITDSIMEQLQSLVLSYDEGKRIKAMNEMCSFTAPAPIMEGEEEYQSDVSAKSVPLNTFFTDYAAKKYLAYNKQNPNPTPAQIEAAKAEAPYLSAKTASNLLMADVADHKYNNLQKLLPQGVTMDQYLGNCLYQSEVKRIVQLVCPDYYTDKDGNPLTPADAKKMEKARKTLEILASGDANKYSTLIDDFVQRLCDIKVPDAQAFSSEAELDDYVYKNRNEVREYSKVATNLQNIITNVPALKAYYENNYTDELRHLLDAKSDLVANISGAVNIISNKSGVGALAAVNGLIIDGPEYSNYLNGVEPLFDFHMTAAKADITRLDAALDLNQKKDVKYEKSLKLYGKKKIVFIDPKIPYQPQADELLVSYGICSVAHRRYGESVCEPFMDASKVSGVIAKDMETIEAIRETFRKKRCIFDGEYPVPNIAECVRIVEKGTDEEKIVLNISLVHHLVDAPDYYNGNTIVKRVRGEANSENFKRLNSIKNSLEIALIGDFKEYNRSSRKSTHLESDIDFIRPSVEMSKKVLRMNTSYMMAMNKKRVDFLRHEIELTGKRPDQLTDHDKGVILAKSIAAGVDSAAMTGRRINEAYFGPMAGAMSMITAVATVHDMFIEDRETADLFGDSAGYLGAAHRLLMEKLPKGATAEAVKQAEDAATAELTQYINDYLKDLKQNFRQAGMYEMGMTNELIKTFYEAVKLTDFTDKHNKGRQDTFFNLVLEPLERVISLSALTKEDKRQAGYAQSLNELAGGLNEYRVKHNPHSKDGKKRLALVVKLIDQLNTGIRANRGFELEGKTVDGQ